jgi:hypothetical protein
MDMEKLIANHMDCKKILGGRHKELIEKHTSDVRKEHSEQLSEAEIDQETQRRLRVDAMWKKASRIRKPNLRW